jgi:hypothetical protein
MIENWEPRISIIEIPVVGVEDESAYYIKIIYTIPELNTTGEYKFTLSKK